MSSIIAIVSQLVTMLSGPRSWEDRVRVSSYK